MKLLRYLIQYRFRDIRDFLANEKKEPLSCGSSLKGKTVLLTGATAGIGLETARYFAERGARLICINRNPDKSSRLKQEIQDRYGSEIKTILCDFSDLQQVKQAAEELRTLDRPIDVLIHNAGVFNTKMQLTADHIEMVFQVNHLGAFIINYLLLEKLKAENRARIIYVNSEGHRFALSGVHLKDLKWKWHFYTGLKSYGAAKTAQLLVMQRFNELLKNTKVTINAMHPGNVRSDMGNNNGRAYLYFKKKLVLSSAKDPMMSAKALYYLAASEDMSGKSGGFYNLTTLEKPAPHARDQRQIGPVWEKSLALCGLQE